MASEITVQVIFRKCVKQIINNSYIVDNERFFRYKLAL